VELRGAGDASPASEPDQSLGAVARFAGRVRARFSDIDRPGRRSGRHPFAGGSHRRCGAIEGAGRKIRYPARGRDRAVLAGGDIETFANQLFRAWELGDAKKNNGILLLVAPNERKVRIEVGYGLEGTLTDAPASTIISGAIVPHFKHGDYSGGVEGGVHGIVAVLRTDPSQWQAQALVAAPKPRWFGEYVIMFIVFSVALGAFALFIKNLIGNILHPPRRGHYVKRGNRLVYASPRHASASSSSWGGSNSYDSGSSSSSGDFSGGGGSSGGGGASGDW
jgi:uncharacterized protein